MPAITSAAPRIGVGRRASNAATIVLEAVRLQVRTQQHPANVILGIVQPASFLLITVMATQGSGRVDVDEAALGAGLIALWGATVWSSGSILRAERWQGTFATILTRPAGLGAILLGKTLGATLRAAVFIGGTVAVTAAVLGDPISVAEPWAFVGALAAVLGSAIVFGVLLSSLFILTRAAARIMEALLYPVFILGGMLVPLSLLPEWADVLSTVISLRWGAELLTASSTGQGQSGVAWLMLIGTTAAYAALARLAFRHVLDRARRAGTLELY